MTAAWRRVLELNQRAPAVFGALDRRHGLPRRAPTAFRGTAEGARLLHRSRRGDGVQGRARHRHDRRGDATACSSSACPAIRSSAASTRCSPSGAACSSTRPTCGSRRAAPTSAYQYDLADPLESLAEGVLHRACATRWTACSIQDRALGRAARAVPASTASSITRSRAAAPSRPASPTAGASLMARDRHAEPVHRVRHDGQARRVRGAAEEPHRRLLRRTGDPPAAARVDRAELEDPWHTQPAWTWDRRRPRRSSSTRTGAIVGRALIDTGANVVHGRRAGVRPRRSPTRGVPEEEVGYVVGTGYGRYRVTFGNTQVTEISCHGRGAVHMFPAHAHGRRHGRTGHQGDPRRADRRDRRLLHERQVRGRHRTLPRRRRRRARHPARRARPDRAPVGTSRSRSARPAPSSPSRKCSPGSAAARRSRTSCSACTARSCRGRSGSCAASASSRRSRSPAA